MGQAQYQTEGCVLSYRSDQVGVKERQLLVPIMLLVLAVTAGLMYLHEGWE
jgi:hypothetical protein